MSSKAISVLFLALFQLSAHGLSLFSGSSDSNTLLKTYLLYPGGATLPIAAGAQLKSGQTLSVEFAKKTSDSAMPAPTKFVIKVKRSVMDKTVPLEMSPTSVKDRTQFKIPEALSDKNVQFKICGVIPRGKDICSARFNYVADDGSSNTNSIDDSMDAPLLGSAVPSDAPSGRSAIKLDQGTQYIRGDLVSSSADDDSDSSETPDQGKDFCGLVDRDTLALLGDEKNAESALNQIKQKLRGLNGVSSDDIVNATSDISDCSVDIPVNLPKAPRVGNNFIIRVGDQMKRLVVQIKRDVERGSILNIVPESQVKQTFKKDI